MSQYAKETSVSVAASKAEIERILERYGASQFMSGWSAEKALIGFVMHDRKVKFVLTMPARSDPAFTLYKRGGSTYSREDSAALKLWEQACRQRWRALTLVVKAKLEAVESGISVFEDEFLANIVLPDGSTVGEATRPTIADAYRTNRVPPLLPDFSGDGGSK